MLDLNQAIAFASLAFLMALSPGPNMAYLVSRSICQGRSAGLVSLSGVLVGFAIYVVLTACGITALLLAVPLAYDLLRLTGAAYLAWLAWKALRPGGHSPFEPKALPADSASRLFGMGLMTNLLNPKVAMLYMSMLPQFIDPARGNLLLQGIELGLLQILMAAMVHTTIIFSASRVARFLVKRPSWARAQRWLMGTVLGLLAVKMAAQSRR